MPNSTSKQTPEQAVLSRFTTERIKVGDIVITAEIHKVVSTFGNQDDGFEVAEVCPCCGKVKNRGLRIMHPGWGQHGLMKLKDQP